MDHGTLYVVATPIGNRDDLAPRARQILNDADLIAAEDTRHTGRLLSHFGIDTPLLALHDHNEEQQVPKLIERLTLGDTIALVCDAGTPLVSDPGYRLVSEAHVTGVPVSPIPGPSSVISAMSVAGLPSDSFVFEGFLPPRSTARRAMLAGLERERRTLIFMESVHKIRATLADMVEIFGSDRPGFIGRELTKLHEQCVRGTLGGLAAMLDDGSIAAKGEFVIVVQGSGKPDDRASPVSSAALLNELLELVPGKKAVDIVARVCGRPRNEVYGEMLAIKGARDSD